jgi:hypothetical protein
MEKCTVTCVWREETLFRSIWSSVKATKDIFVGRRFKYQTSQNSKIVDATFEVVSREELGNDVILKVRNIR